MIFLIQFQFSGYPSSKSFPVSNFQHIHYHPVGSELITKITIIFQIKPFLLELLPPAALFSKHVSKPTEDIIGIGKNKQGKNDYHSHNLGIFQELSRWACGVLPPHTAGRPHVRHPVPVWAVYS